MLHFLATIAIIGSLPLLALMFVDAAATQFQATRLYLAMASTIAIAIVLFLGVVSTSLTPLLWFNRILVLFFVVVGAIADQANKASANNKKNSTNSTSSNKKKKELDDSLRIPLASAVPVAVICDVVACFL